MPRNPHAKPRALSDDEYGALLSSQDGHCAVCLTAPKARRLDNDHCHKCGETRGLLCHFHNRLLPARITPAELRALATYIETHKCIVPMGDTPKECPNRPEWAMPGVPAIVGGGFCVHCSKVAGEWVKCEASE